MKLKELAEEVGALKFWFGAIAVGVLSLNGVYQFLREAPALVNANTAHVEMHHDTIEDMVSMQDDLSDAQESMQATLQVHEAADAALASTADELQRGQAYLICDRQRRRAELADATFARDCESEMLEGR